MIRPNRAVLKDLRATEQLTPKLYRIYYRKAKGNAFRSRAHILSHLRADGAIKEA